VNDQQFHSLYLHQFDTPQFVAYSFWQMLNILGSTNPSLLLQFSGNAMKAFAYLMGNHVSQQWGSPAENWQGMVTFK
jgi:hypothetical protein